MDFLQIAVLAIVQGLAELLPVSSSAHVIVAEKLMGLDPTTPRMTLLLVMLHTGTMFAVIAYFWAAWREAYFGSAAALRRHAAMLALATVLTGVVGLSLQALIKRWFFAGSASFEIEHLFGNARLMAGALAAAGVLIIASSRLRPRGDGELGLRSAAWIGAVQGLCLPFRGFSRSGATISTAMVLGVEQRRAEAFSFALAVVLTPAVIAKEGWRVIQAQSHAAAPGGAMHGLLPALAPGLLGMVLSFAAGLLALRWLSRWLQGGRWYLFGAYCLLAAGVVLAVG
ncbi:MAG: undecaprenyl-diphosphate phosphatase [Burkholderiales bacterium]|nr:undecaprenyl-diphosphate phosphatase [Burkholderiales bacterium]